MFKWNIKKSRFYIPSVDLDINENDLIDVPDQLYNQLSEKISKGGFELCVIDGELSCKETTKVYEQEFYEQQNLNLESKSFLKNTDWIILRELERLYLSDTDIFKQREAARKNVLHQEILILSE